MHIDISFNDELLQRYAARQAPLLFSISIADANSHYPEEAWMDFGCVILGWWITACLNLINGSKEETMRFMDGPYALIALVRASTLTLRSSEGPAFEVVTTLADFQRVLGAAANRVLRHVVRLGLRGDDVVELEVGLRKLRDARARGRKS